MSNLFEKAAYREDNRTDEELVECVLAGQAEQFTVLYERYYARTRRVAYVMTGTPQGADDLTQEVFMVAFRKLRQFEGRSSFSTWFYRLTVNCCLGHRQRERRTLPVTSDDFHLLNLPGRTAHGEGEILRQQVQRRVQAALLSLKPKLRMVVVLKDIEGLSYDEIALRMKCSKGTVGTWLFRARKLLARKLAGLQGEL